MKTNPYLVYVRADEQGHISAVQSSAFLTETAGWVEIDRGYGDRYHHAQANYLPEPLYDERGVHRYRLLNGRVVAQTPQEMEREAAMMPVPEENAEELLLEMAADHEYRLCLLELDIEESEVNE